MIGLEGLDYCGMQAAPLALGPTFQFLLGLPALRPGALWSRAATLNTPVLLSANALSRWTTDAIGLRHWNGFDRRHLGLVKNRPVALDSGGFIAARLYRGYPWSTEDYLDLAASATFLWWAAQDWCVEPEIAHDESAVLDRISGTLRLNTVCLNGALRRGIADRFVPVLQGWHPHHYLRCLDRMPWVRENELVGIGSMCRRHLHGDYGIMHVLDVLDRAFDGSNARFHLFGLKSQAIAIASQHPRVASADSQAYGIAARRTALEARQSKTDTMLADVMAHWYRQQLALISARPPVPPRQAWQEHSPVTPTNEIEARIAAAMEDLRDLHEDGEIDWTNLSPQAAYEFAFLDA
jgi:hypothetical protein